MTTGLVPGTADDLVYPRLQSDREGGPTGESLSTLRERIHQFSSHHVSLDDEAQ
ncbi:hypothetical protein P3H15_28265 [Rhodococcus sp. T2V]|uniref:hypothetical protein n=1 Tax=Rhodococcus sp. T2V TaxID=3034164 RepID=UPI0023E13533|nr:hypothetical protein [Rhodococcus sp. T2V]MDF3308914.1 hypothetical protein [Rhodococcus sp. T2V]